MTMNTELINQIKDIISKERLVSIRVNEVRNLGVYCKEVAVGSGGKGRIIERSKETLMQLGYGHGRNNYAMCAVIEVKL